MTEPDTTPQILPIKYPRHFHVTPDEIICRMRDGWLTGIENGFTPMIDTVVPYLEMEAVSRFKKEISLCRAWEPKMTDGYESWRLFWLKEARHNCKFYNPLGVANDHLSTICQAALNVMLAASALRDAIAEGKAEQASALGILLICEAIQGGYSLEYEATLQTNNALQKAKKSAYKKGFGQEQDDMNKARLACIDGAGRRWKENSSILIGTMADDLEARLLQNIEKLPSLDTVPKAKTIKAWLRQAAKDGKLDIPDAAQRRGRPPKAGK